MRAIWKGSISFGLVNIPIALFPATRTEELRFHLLRASDLSPVNYKRVAEADGQEVPWEQIVKGYEYEKGKYVVLKEEDFARVDIEATRTIDISDFVPLEQVDPMFFSKPYYMIPEKGGERAYALLHDALRDSGKIGIAKVVIKTREHLASVKPAARGLVLELMHFAAELVDASEWKIPEVREIGKREVEMAKALISGMSSEWDPTRYKDDYREAVHKLIEEKIEHGGELPGKPRPKPKPGKVIDLVSVLQESLAQTEAKKKAAAKSAKERKQTGGAPARKKRRAA
ncbi:MAG: Ku protein [Verrucomicrobia bacterium]|nr:Ku protein [Verrucomicrobiota bacterium]